MKNLKQQIDLFILENIDKSAGDLVVLIKDKFGEKYTESGIRTKKHRLQKSNSEMELNPVTAIEQEEKPKYIIKGNNVNWKYRHGVMEIPVETLDQIFYEYSIHGLNLSQVKIQNKHGFNAIQWQSFKRTFDLVKDSDVFSPYTLSLYSEKEQCDMIAQKIGEKYTPKNMRDVIVYEDEKQRKKAYDKGIKTIAELDLRRQEFETELLDYVTQSKIAPVVKKTTDVKIGNAVVTVADLHVGADIQPQRNLPGYNIDILERKLDDVSKETNARKAKAVTLIINGDLIETFTGLNHINSWKNIDKKYGYGTKATIMATEILTRFIEKVNNVTEVILISGNHDRVTSNNGEDVTGEVVHWVHYVLQARFGNNFKVSWDYDVASRLIDDCGFIITHGHLGLSRKNPELLVNQYGFTGKFNLVLMAHLHTRKILADSMMYRVMHCPSMFTGNDYSKGLGFTTLSGFTFITIKNGYPVVTDIPID